jgi:transaldolase
MPDSPLLRLKALGQSVWLDYLDRDLVRSGRLQAMMAVRASAASRPIPAIFEKAILHTEHYDAEISAFTASGLSAGEICEELVVADIRAAADVLLPLYESSGRSDGFVSLELSPHLVDDEQATIAEARRLRDLVDRPNLLLKVPATDAGIAALRTLIGEGTGVNVTLLFSLERYRDVVDAYMMAWNMRWKRA